MATKLGLYKSALRLLGSQRIDALTDTEERRYVIDDCYDEVLAECLEAGQWNFAIKAVELETAASVEPTFGYDYGHTIPSDLVRLVGISADDTFYQALEDYKVEQGYYWTNVSPLYIRYVSDDSEYGNDLTIWPPAYTKFVYSSIAERICMSLTQSETKVREMAQRALEAKRSAMSYDAMSQPAPIIKAGSWAESRFRGMRLTGKRYLRS